MANFLSNLSSKGLFGGLAGAYGSNKGFRNNANDFLFGSESQMEPYNKNSLQALLEMLTNGGGLEGNQNYQEGSNFLSQLLGGQFAPNYENSAAPYLQNFNERIAPGIAERFAGAGTGAGAYNSSGFQNSIAQAGRGLQSDLASMFEGLKQQHLGSQLTGANQALGYAQQPITNRFGAAQAIPNQYYEIPGQAGAVQGGLNSFLQGLGGLGRGGF